MYFEKEWAELEKLPHSTGKFRKMDTILNKLDKIIQIKEIELQLQQIDKNKTINSKTKPD